MVSVRLKDTLTTRHKSQGQRENADSFWFCVYDCFRCHDVCQYWMDILVWRTVWSAPPPRARARAPPPPPKQQQEQDSCDNTHGSVGRELTPGIGFVQAIFLSSPGESKWPSRVKRNYTTWIYVWEREISHTGNTYQFPLDFSNKQDLLWITVHRSQLAIDW